MCYCLGLGLTSEGGGDSVSWLGLEPYPTLRGGTRVQFMLIFSHCDIYCSFLSFIFWPRQDLVCQFVRIDNKWSPLAQCMKQESSEQWWWFSCFRNKNITKWRGKNNTRRVAHIIWCGSADCLLQDFWRFLGGQKQDMLFLLWPENTDWCRLWFCFAQVPLSSFGASSLWNTTSISPLLLESRLYDAVLCTFFSARKVTHFGCHCLSYVMNHIRVCMREVCNVFCFYSHRIYNLCKSILGFHVPYISYQVIFVYKTIEPPFVLWQRDDSY